jgi:hypothetical protein
VAVVAGLEHHLITAVSWEAPRADIFGRAPDSSIWHKYDTGNGEWQPPSGFERVPATAAGAVEAVSWGPNRFDLFYPSNDGGIAHKYWDGHQWGPSFESEENLGGDLWKKTEGIAVSSWGENRLDVVAKGSNSNYIHKAWTGSDWYPSGTDWEDLGGGPFDSPPATVSWGPGRLDVFGNRNGTVRHRYWNSDHWSEWEDFDGGPFKGEIAATSWGPNRFDVWAINKEDHQLNHKFWDGSQYKGWEQMGGEFGKATPSIVHWMPDRTDIVGLFDSDDDEKNHLKSYDGSNWNPSLTGWYDLSDENAFQPTALARKGTSKSIAVSVEDVC